MKNKHKVKRPETTRLGYTCAQAAAGTADRLPEIETWPNQYRDYEIRIEVPEYTSVCPKTGLPDFGTITIEYVPGRRCLELKSLKLYLLAYRNKGIFYENAVNRILEDIVAAARPQWADVAGKFTTRGGMRSTIIARYPASRTQHAASGPEGRRTAPPRKGG